MKIPHRFALSLALVTALVPAVPGWTAAPADLPPPAQSAAEADWKAWSDENTRAPSEDAMKTPLDYMKWREVQGRRQRELGLRFIDRYPADPRRWFIVAQFHAGLPTFAREWGAPAKGTVMPTPLAIDEAAAAAWKARVAELRAALAKAQDVPAEVKADLAQREAFDREMRAKGEAYRPLREIIEDAERRQVPVDFARLRAAVDAHIAADPRSRFATMLAGNYLQLLAKTHPDREVAELESFTQCANAEVSELAQGKLRQLALSREPLDLVFTAADGRPVDLKALRGKVVLVDFWATWCHPCVKELPNVKQVYAAYHDHGFEVVGIALENAGLAAGDSPAQAEEKRAAARKFLLEFAAKEGLPWPQYYDGKGWQNDVSRKYSIYSIPAMFLLDQTGRVATTDARGEKLGAEVKRLLKR